MTGDHCHLFGDVTGKTMLEVGCGSGHPLLYQAQHGTGELWDVDISEGQLKNVQALLKDTMWM